jgi:hypothetical protein
MRALSGSNLDPSPRWKNSNEIITFADPFRRMQNWHAAQKVVNGVKTIMVNDPLRSAAYIASPRRPC